MYGLCRLPALLSVSTKVGRPLYTAKVGLVAASGVGRDNGDRTRSR